MFTIAEAHLIAVMARIEPATQPLELLGLATASRGATHGHSCIELSAVEKVGATLLPAGTGTGKPTEISWPAADEWSSALVKGLTVANPDEADREPIRPLVFDGHRIYLQRYWVHESRVANQLRSRSSVAADHTSIESVVESLFEFDEGVADAGADFDDRQKRAVEVALQGGLSIITGGPGTGKTFTIARILAGAHMLAAARGRSLNVALAAPTGKAAARITESQKSVQNPATTIHQLLGFAPGDKFRHNRNNPLPHDMVIIDEASMVSLSLMSRLLEAVRPDATVVLVGDPDQLASVDVGTVLSDIIGPVTASASSSDSLAPPGGLEERITVLKHAHRFGELSPIATLAETIQSGDYESTRAAIESASCLDWVSPTDTSMVRHLTDQVIDASAASVKAAMNHDPAEALRAAVSLKVLCATRMHRFGLHHWSDLIEAAVCDQIGIDTPHRWFAGLPIIITANDRVNRVANGDTGVVVSVDGEARVALPGAEGIRYISPSRLSQFEPWWAMTIHKSQGSEFDHVVVSLPPAGSPVLTRELLYTAITRAKSKITILADEESIREALLRPVSRASGLRSRLWPA